MCVACPIVVPELILLGLLIGGGVLLMSWITSRCQDRLEGSDEMGGGLLTPCHRCRHLNPTHANYCARCGCSLG